ncbi:MAG: SDR family oxidoreductase [Promethearchaeota archaeon]|nr:MAG: SDR family oxidoreductase [Candidatus Lokiarchaeota archaeon]
MVNNSLKGKGALITGAASGFGKGVALEYAKRGAQIALIDINEEALIAIEKEIKEITQEKVISVVCDVSKSDEVKAMIKNSFKELDNIYILFNNAGIGLAYGRTIVRVKEEHFDKIININLKGQWLVASEIWRKMKSQNFGDTPLSGKIICTSSIAGMVPNAKLPAYSISKAGVLALMNLLAKTLAPEITVNSIAPGYHVTGIYLNSEDDMRLTMGDGNVKTPLNRIGTVEDVVNLMIFLASNRSNFITGHNFPIDGGIAEVGVPAHFIDSEV